MLWRGGGRIGKRRANIRGEFVKPVLFGLVRIGVGRDDRAAVGAGEVQEETIPAVRGNRSAVGSLDNKSSLEAPL